MGFQVQDGSDTAEGSRGSGPQSWRRRAGKTRSRFSRYLVGGSTLVVALALVVYGPARVAAAATTGTAVDLTGSSFLSGVACPAATTCEAVGFDQGTAQTGVLAPITVSTASTSEGALTAGIAVPASASGSIGPLSGVACPSAGECLAVGVDAPSGADGVVLPFSVGTGGTPSPGAALGTNGVAVAGGALYGISCPSSTLCVAVGSVDNSAATDGIEGLVLPITASGSSWSLGTPTAVSAAGTFFGVACPTTSSCQVVGVVPSGAQGVAVPLTVSSGSVSAGTAALGSSGTEFFSVSCASSSDCVLVGNSYDSTTGDSTALAAPITETTGTSGPADTVSTVVPVGFSGATTGEAVTGGLYGVVCPGTTECGGVGIYTAVATSTSSGVVASLTQPLTSASAPSAVGAAGTGFLTAAACAGAPSGSTTDNCVAVGQDPSVTDGVAFPFAVTVSAPVGPAAQLSNLLSAVAGVGPGKSFAAKVSAAQSAYATGNVTVTCNVLGAFVNEVSAQSGVSITATEASTLESQAAATETALGCSG